MPTHKPARFRRFAAFWIDLFLTLLSIVLLAPLSSLLGDSGNMMLVMSFAMLIPLMLFFCRDFLLNGRSLGKRIMGLAVVDNETGDPPSAKKLLVKAIFLFFYFFDGLFLIFSGKSLAERASNTIVIRSRAASGPLSWKRWIVALAVSLAFVFALSSLMSFAMNAAKKAESYPVAQDYLTSSSAFAALDADPDDVSLTGFSFSTRYESGEAVTENAFTFRIQSRTFTVVCHPMEGDWYVCPDCTEFD